MDTILSSMEASNKIQLKDTKIVPKSAQPLGFLSDPTVYRLELEPNTTPVLPRSIIVKLEQKERAPAFQKEIDAYNNLQSLQGTVIPTVLGEGLFHGGRALFLSDVDGKTLYEAAAAEIDEKKIETYLEDALYALWECKAEYKDENPDNFLVCQDRIVIVDLEDVEFLVEGKRWERSVNSGNLDYLLSRYSYMRNPDRPRSPMDFSRVTLNDPYASNVTLA